MAKKGRDLERVGPGTVTTTVSASYAGLLPPPAMLEYYARILPGGVEWIIKTAESQIAHRQALETKKLESDIQREKTGQVFAFVITLVVILVGGTVIYVGRSTAGGFALIIAALASLAGVFIYGRHKTSKELEARRRFMQQVENKNQ